MGYRSPQKQHDDYQREAALRAEIVRLREPWQGVLEDDWAYILSLPGDGGRGRFWKEVLTKMRAAFTAPAAPSER